MIGRARELAGRLGRARLGVLSVGSGTAAGQGVAALSAPVLTRLYAPEAYGVYTWVLSVTMVLSAVATLRLEFAVPLPQEEDDARAVTRLTVGAVALTTLLTALGVLVTVLLRRDGSALPAAALWSLPPLVALTALFTLFSQVALRERAYTTVGVRAFAQTGGAALAQMGLAALTRSSLGLLGGQAVGRLLALVGLAGQARRALRPTPTPLGAMLRRYRRFPSVLAPAALLNILGTYIPVLIITQRYGTHAAGNLGIASQVVLLPSALVSTAVGQVFVGELSARLRSGQGGAGAIFTRATKALGLVGVALTAGVLLLAGPVFPIVLGSTYDTAPEFARAMAVSVGLGIVVSPLSYLLIALERTTQVLVLDVIRVVTIAGVGYAAYGMGHSATGSAWAMFTAQALVYVVIWLVCRHTVRRSDGGD